MQMIQEEGRGALVYQQQEGRGIGILNKIRAYALQDQGADAVEANERLDLPVDSRDYRQCAEVLFDLGLCKVKVISNNPGKLRALEEAGLEIVERISIEVEAPESAARYLQTKKEKLGHLPESWLLRKSYGLPVLNRSSIISLSLIPSFLSNSLSVVHCSTASFFLPMAIKITPRLK